MQQKDAQTTSWAAIALGAVSLLPLCSCSNLQMAHNPPVEDTLPLNFGSEITLAQNQDNLEGIAEWIPDERWQDLANKHSSDPTLSELPLIGPVYEVSLSDKPFAKFQYAREVKLDSCEPSYMLYIENIAGTGIRLNFVEGTNGSVLRASKEDQTVASMLLHRREDLLIDRVELSDLQGDLKARLSLDGVKISCVHLNSLR